MNESSSAGQAQGKFMMVAAWVTALALLIWIFGNWEENAANPNQNPKTSSGNGIREVTLAGNRDAHYLVNGKINGKEVTFLLDTGATYVAVPKGIAQELGLAVKDTGYADTANGRVRVGFTRLQSLEIGSIKLSGVDASINGNMPGDIVLLGMSALKQLQLIQENNQLTLRQMVN